VGDLDTSTTKIAGGKKMKTKWIALLLTLCLVLPIGLASAGDMVTELPRNETLYFLGLQWGSPNGWNPFSNDMNNAMTMDQNASGARVTMWETLYMYNFLDGSFTPLLADGPFVWNDDKTEMTVKLNTAAKWNDGTPVTADDVVYTFETAVKYENNAGIGAKPFVASVEAVDPATVVFKAVLTEDGKPANPMQIEAYIAANYVLQKAWLQTLEERSGYDAIAMKTDAGEDVVWSCTYTYYNVDDVKVILVLEDN